MISKNDFDLMYEGNKNLFNIYDFSESSLKPYLADEESINYFKVLVKTYSSEKTLPFGKLILKELDNVLVSKMEDYPLPGFMTSKKIGVVNLAPIDAKLLSDYSAPDVYACFAYTIILSKLMSRSGFTDRLEDQVSLFLDSAFMGMFGKKSGMIGSYRHLIPKLKFIIAMYTHEGMFGNKPNDIYRNKVASKYFLDYKEMKLDYDFKSITDTIKCINDNNIISLSENVFSTSVINYGGIISLPMFEDLSRMFATLLMVFVKGNHLFSTYWYKKSKSVYEKLIKFGLTYI